MNLLSFSFADVPSTIGTIIGFIIDNPMLSAVLLLSYLLFYAYEFIHNTSADSEVYESDLLSSGLSTIMIAFLLVGLGEDSKGFDFTSIDIGDSSTQAAIFLLIYAALLIVFAFTKIMPKFVVIILGNSELDFFINFMAMLFTDVKVEITGIMIFVLAVPLVVLFVIQRLRKLMR